MFITMDKCVEALKGASTVYELSRIEELHTRLAWWNKDMDKIVRETHLKLLAKGPYT